MNLLRFILVSLCIIYTIDIGKTFCLPNKEAINDSIQGTQQAPAENSPVSSNDNDSISSGSINNFGPEYTRYLDKADKAFRLGFFNRAQKYFRKAAEINPKSLYIQYHLREIASHKYQFRNFIFYMNFDKPVVLIKVLIYFILFFIVSMIVVLISILIHRERSENLEKRKQSLKEVYQELLVDFLFNQVNTSIVPSDLALISKSSFNRKILIDQMIDLSINLSGQAKDKLRKLYYSLGLNKDSLKKAYSRKWYIKVKGFRELAFMNITDANEEIIKCLRSKNEIVRMEAQLALVRLNYEESLDFLDYLVKPFTLWEQLTVYETIIFHNLPVPKFEKWLTLKNKSVVIFALRMIDIFKQKDAYLNLFWLLVNEDPDIRNHTINVIGNLKIKEAIPHLKRLYKLETYENCRAIIQAIGKMPDESILNFLKLVIDKEDDVQLQIDAAIAINNSGESGKSALKKLLNSDYKNYQIIVKHVLDKRIA